MQAVNLAVQEPEVWSSVTFQGPLSQAGSKAGCECPHPSPADPFTPRKLRYLTLLFLTTLTESASCGSHSLVACLEMHCWDSRRQAIEMLREHPDETCLTQQKGFKAIFLSRRCLLRCRKSSGRAAPRRGMLFPRLQRALSEGQGMEPGETHSSSSGFQYPKKNLGQERIYRQVC